MGKITLICIGEIAEITGDRKTQFEVPTPVTFVELLTFLEANIGENFIRELNKESFPGGSPFYQVLVNGYQVTGDAIGKQNTVNDGDEILISPPLAGG